MGKRVQTGLQGEAGGEGGQVQVVCAPHMFSLLLCVCVWGGGIAKYEKVKISLHHTHAHAERFFPRTMAFSPQQLLLFSMRFLWS